MVSIRDLQQFPVDYKCISARYHEGPDRFDEWYKLAREKYPNLTTVICTDNNLTSFACDAQQIMCSRNPMTVINCPNATVIHCLGNPVLEHIIAPELHHLRLDFPCQMPFMEVPANVIIKDRHGVQQMFGNKVKSARK